MPLLNSGAYITDEHYMNMKWKLSDFWTQTLSCTLGTVIGILLILSRPEAFLPHGLDAVADIIKDMAALDATPGREETTDDAGDVAADVKLLRVVDAHALHTETEAADAGKYDRMTFRQPLLDNLLKIGDHAGDGTF